MCTKQEACVLSGFSPDAERILNQTAKELALPIEISKGGKWPIKSKTTYGYIDWINTKPFLSVRINRDPRGCPSFGNPGNCPFLTGVMRLAVAAYYQGEFK